MYSKGYPLVTVTRNYDINTIELKQAYYCTDDWCKNKTNLHKIWPIPINYASTKKLDFNVTTAEYWLTSASMVLKTNISSENWIIINKQQTGQSKIIIHK